MKIPLDWLKCYVAITLPPEELAHRLSMAGAEVEAIHRTGANWDGIRVGHVVGLAPHPNADKLRLATIDLGEAEPRTVVCGAPNIAEGQKIAFASEGVRLHDPDSGEVYTLRKAKIRGVESAGMVCSERELGLSDEHSGILVLNPEAPIGTPLEQVLGETVLEITPTPNRPDHMAVLGIAREVAALTGCYIREPPRGVPDGVTLGAPAADRTSVAIEAPDLCPRYIAVVIEGVRVGPSPNWLQKDLLAAGQRPINNIVDVTNYVMLEMGQPLHAFDFDKLRGRRIVVRRARARERIRLLDGSEHELTTEQLVIADGEDAVAVAGVIGGGGTEVTEATTTILLESAAFIGPNIRRTASSLKARTEASARFEKRLDPELAAMASERALRLVLETAGGMPDVGHIDAYPEPQRPLTVHVPRARVEQVLGMDVPVEQVRTILDALGFGVRWIPSAKYVVQVPCWRSDVSGPDDVVEEIGRIIGYDALPSSPLSGALPGPDPQPLLQTREQVRDALAAAGFAECITYTTTSRSIIEQVQPLASITSEPPLLLRNPLSAERPELRTSLRPGLLETFATNAMRRRRPLRLFEVGKVFLPRPSDLPEERVLAAALIGGAMPASVHGDPARPLDLFDAKAAADAVAAGLGLALQYAAADPADPALLPGSTALVQVGAGRQQQTVGVVGQVDPVVAARFDIDEAIFLLDLDVTALSAVARESLAVRTLSRFPAVVEDLAVVVDDDTPSASVEAVLLRQLLVERADLFDLYRGDAIPAGKKSLAYAVTYRAPDRTLTDTDAARIRGGIVKQLERELGASVRSG